MPFIPHTPDDVKAMLDAIDAPNIEALFDEIDESLRHTELNLPDGQTEMTLSQHAKALANQNKSLTCFTGAGSYEHHIPAAVWDIASRGEFLTAYTPYQAEASQGTLQLLYEFQTMIAELTGMDVANASLYDGATALTEAVWMAARIQRRHASHRILVPESLHPHYRETLQTIVQHQDITLIPVPMDKVKGTTSYEALSAYDDETITALIIPQPNFFGVLEDVDALTDWAHAHDTLAIAVVNPISLGMLKPPGAWGGDGVDIASGEGQPLGVPMASGGPYFGFFSTKKQHARQIPGRLIGQTIDEDGNVGYTLTLQAREQHIRRAKATSNICTNQGLLVTAATIHMSLIGAEGLTRIAYACYENTRLLLQELTQIPRVTQVFTSSPFFHEVLLQLPIPAAPILQGLAEQGIAGGYATEEVYPDYPNTLLVCATECRTQDEISTFAETLKKLLLESTELTSHSSLMETPS